MGFPLVAEVKSPTGAHRAACGPPFEFARALGAPPVMISHSGWNQTYARLRKTTGAKGSPAVTHTQGCLGGRHETSGVDILFVTLFSPYTEPPGRSACHSLVAIRFLEHVPKIIVWNTFQKLLSHKCGAMMPAQVFFELPLPHHLPPGISSGGFRAPTGARRAACGPPFEFARALGAPPG